MAMVIDETIDMEVENNKKQLEWELSTLETDDLRSHAWYHGNRVDRNEAERLLRKYVQEEYGYTITTTTTTTTNNNNTSTTGTNTSIRTTVTGIIDSPERKYGIEDSDGIEDVSSMSSDSDFGIDDGLEDGRCVVPDPSLAASTAMATALLLEQRRRLNGFLPLEKSIRSYVRRKHYYCFLVRDSMNIRPPGRYVVSCLRVDTYEDSDAALKQNKGDEKKCKKFLHRQRLRRYRRQQQHPVLHFVINEVSFA